MASTGDAARHDDQPAHEAQRGILPPRLEIEVQPVEVVLAQARHDRDAYVAELLLARVGGNPEAPLSQQCAEARLERAPEPLPGARIAGSGAHDQPLKLVVLPRAQLEPPRPEEVYPLRQRAHSQRQRTPADIRHRARDGSPAASVAFASGMGGMSSLRAKVAIFGLVIGAGVAFVARTPPTPGELTVHDRLVMPVYDVVDVPCASRVLLHGEDDFLVSTTLTPAGAGHVCLGTRAGGLRAFELFSGETFRVSGESHVSASFSVTPSRTTMIDRLVLVGETTGRAIELRRHLRVTVDADGEATVFVERREVHCR
jgi:hypothetical protein